MMMSARAPRFVFTLIALLSLSGARSWAQPTR